MEDENRMAIARTNFNSEPITYCPLATTSRSQLVASPLRYQDKDSFCCVFMC